MQRLIIRNGRPSAARALTLADKVDVQIDVLLALRDIASDERRSHDDTERLFDALADTGRTIGRLGRG